MSKFVDCVYLHSEYRTACNGGSSTGDSCGHEFVCTKLASLNILVQLHEIANENVQGKLKFGVHLGYTVQ